MALRGLQGQLDRLDLLVKSRMGTMLRHLLLCSVSKILLYLNVCNSYAHMLTNVLSNNDIGQGQTKGPDPTSPTDDSQRMFGRPLNDEERKEALTKIHDQVKISLQKLTKPDGGKDSPAKTCSELFATYPEKPSGTHPLLLFHLL